MPNSIIREMNHQVNPRILYLKTFIKSLPTTCPECGNNLTVSADESEMECTHCGLITSGSIEYVGLHRIKYPYGRH